MARALALLALLIPLGARAQPPAEVLDQYRQVATQGQEAFNRREYAEARRLWEHARSIVPNPRVYRLLGRVAAQQGDHVEAVRMFRLALSAPENGNPLSEARRREIEDVLLPRALAHVGEILLEVEPGDAAITVDGEPAALHDGWLLLPVGTYVVAAHRPGYVGDERTIAVRAGAREPMRLELEPEPPALVEPILAEPDEASPPSRELEPEAPASRELDLVGPIVVLGVAAAGLLTFAIAGGLAFAEDERLADHCGWRRAGTCTDAELGDLRALSAAADVGWVGAAVAAAAGLVWLWVVLSSGPQPRSGARARDLVVSW